MRIARCRRCRRCAALPADAPLIAVNTVANCACVRSGDRVPALRLRADVE